MKKVLIMASVAAISATTFAAPAASTAPTTKHISTLELTTLCKDKSNPQSQSYCGGFGQGVYDGYLMMVDPKKQGKKGGQTICIPQDAKDPGIVDAFIQWTEANPSFNSKPAAVGVLNFLDQRYPCKK